MKTFITIALLFSLLSLQGCGVIMSMRGAAFETDLQNVNPNKLEDPVRSDVFMQVQSVAVADLSDGLTDYPKDNVLMYQAMITELHNLLEESGKFRVVSPEEFRAELRKVNGPINPRITPDYEIDSIYHEVGQSLGVHAVVSAGLEEVGNVKGIDNQIRYMGQILKDGGLTIELEGVMKMIRSRKEEILYEQKSDVTWASGTSGLETISATKLRTMTREMLKPMVDQMLEKHSG
ncbi:hypothetical protein EDB94_1215 [Marinobacter sp. 3-2]|jgi:hypothetical protein|uniref:hypothetical protein n=1 Tax=Marinobacter sp. 3-2 TaxID=2485141 RepID=UPI000D34F108|nr:hypothetical protein [Marinobacter sp. 3-2]ROQ47499.1 hypothetical protein EDB94_1215 [Marinobacter sp. 3-2]